MKYTFTLFLSILLTSQIHSQNISLNWVVQSGGSSYDLGNAITTDANGNVYSTGRFEGTADFDPSAGVLNHTSNGGADIFIQKLNTDGDLLWVKQIGGDLFDVGSAIYCDKVGNIYITGNFSDTVDFDPGAGTHTLVSSGFDIFVLKLDTQGVFAWAQSFGGSGSDFGRAIAVDSIGNVFTTGSFDNTVDFDPGAGTLNLVTNGNYDVFIHKLDANGSFEWVRQIGGSSNDVGNSIATDVSGNVYTVGRFQGTADFNPAGGPLNLTSNGSNDIFIHKLDPNGGFQWVKQIGGTSGDAAYSVTTDINEDLIVTGSFRDVVDFDPNLGTMNLTSSGNADIFLLKMDVNGNLIWAKSTGNTGADEGVSVFSDISGDLYVAGYFGGSVDFDPGAATASLTSFGSSDIFLQKLDNNGDYIWATHSGGAFFDIAYSVTGDLNGNVFTTGYFQGTADFKPGMDVFNLTTFGIWDAFVQKLSECTVTNGIDVVTACDSFTWIDGNTYSASNNTATHVLSNVQGCDSVVTLDLDVSYTSFYTDVVEACDSFTWIDGNTYSASNNTATHVLSNSQGCDSVVTLDLNVSYTSFYTDVVTACDSFTWIDGNTYTVSNNTATHVLSNAQGCDSVVALDLNVSYTSFYTDVVEACDSFTWIDGNTYTASNNTATHVLSNAQGCDSVVTLDLDVSYASFYTDVVTACDSFTWIDGNSYTVSNNTATHFLSNAQGCDSVVTLDLDVSYTSYYTDGIEACDSFTWIDGTTYTTSNNTATHVLSNAQGCDSVVMLDLDVSYSSYYTDVVEACDSFTWVDGNTYTASNNTATRVLSNAQGCDSVVTLDLDVSYSSFYTDVVEVCDSFTWVDGNTYTASINTATHVLSNAQGCDSVVTLDLDVSYTSYANDVVTACDSFTWIDGNTYTASNNTSVYTLSSTDGCDSVISLQLTIYDLDTGITLNGDSITSNDLDASYQWLDCNSSFAIIPGETDQVFSPTVNGIYAVQVTENNCIDTSACISITSVGIIENSLEDNFLLYPNPTDGSFTLQFDNGLKKYSVKLISPSGELIESRQLVESNAVNFEITGASGIYLVELKDENGGKAVLKLIKK